MGRQVDRSRRGPERPYTHQAGSDVMWIGPRVVALGVVLLCLSYPARAEEEARVVPLEGQVGPYGELQDAHFDGGSVTGSVPLRPNETSAHARLQIEERAVGSSSFFVRFCREPCRLNPDGPEVAQARGTGPFDMTFPLEGIDVLYWRVAVDEGIRVDAHVSGSLVLAGAGTGDVDPMETHAVDGPVAHGVPTMAALVLVGTILAAAGVAGAFPAWMPRLRKWTAWAPMAAFFTRRETLLEHPVRKRLHALVHDTPGIHLRGLRRAMAMPPGQVEHHLQKLVQAGYVVTHTERGYTGHFVPGTVDRRLMASLARVKSVAARSLLSRVASGGTRTLVAAADEVGIAPSTASYHMNCLERLGLVEVQANGIWRWRVTALGRAFLRLFDQETGSGSRNGPGNV